jgi:predicted alpha/beta-fold hydrolase
VTTYKSIRNLNVCVEIRGRVGMGSWLQFGRGELGWVVGCSLGGESWHGEEEGEIEEERVGKVCIYWLLSMESPTATSRRYTHR